MEDTDDLKTALRHKKKENPIKSKDLLSSGSTLLNLAGSGRISGLFPKGKYVLFVGDSTSGKTFLGLTCIAEACKNKNFADYRIIYDNPEDGALMDIEKFFGSVAAERLEPPRGTKEEPIYSETVEDFYFNVDDANKQGEPFIYILDSMDAIDTKEDQDKFDEVKKAHRKGKETSGSYGMSKAKLNSQNLRKVISGMRKTGSILIIICQTRDTVESFGFGDKKTRAGGRALRFYATLEIWSSIKQKLAKTVKGKKRQIGVLSKVQLKKNRLTGRDRSVDIPIYHSYGIDDLGSCVDYLVEEGHWKDGNGGINAVEFDVRLKRDNLIQHIEQEELERELRVLVGKVWNEIEEASSLKRRPRYE